MPGLGLSWGMRGDCKERLHETQGWEELVLLGPPRRVSLPILVISASNSNCAHIPLSQMGEAGLIAGHFRQDNHTSPLPAHSGHLPSSGAGPILSHTFTSCQLPLHPATGQLPLLSLSSTTALRWGSPGRVVQGLPGDGRGTCPLPNAHKDVCTHTLHTHHTHTPAWDHTRVQDVPALGQGQAFPSPCTLRT